MVGGLSESPPNLPNPVHSPPHFDLAMAFDDFEDNTFEREEGNIDDNDISVGSEADELDVVEEDELCDEEDQDDVEVEDLSNEEGSPSSPIQ